jgi:hypothetical protein
MHAATMREVVNLSRATFIIERQFFGKGKLPTG